MTPKRPNIPVAVPIGDDSSTIVGSEELRAQREKLGQLGRPSIEAIERIFGDLVNDNNREMLRDEMGRFYLAYIEQRTNTTRSQAARKEQLQAISRASDELLHQLSKPPADWVVESCLWLLPIDKIVSQLSALQEAVRENLPAPSNAIKGWCVAELAVVYKRCTGNEPGVSRPPGGGEIYGPFVRFVQSVAREINIEISTGTIEAWWKRRNG